MQKKIRPGRPPAPWMHELAKLDLTQFKKNLSYDEICELFDITQRSMQSFAGKLDIKEEYELRGRFAVRVFDPKALKKATREYIELQLH